MNNITFKTTHGNQDYVLKIAPQTGDKAKVVELYRNNRDRTPCPNWGEMSFDDDNCLTEVEVYLQAIAQDDTIDLSGESKTYKFKSPLPLSSLEVANKASSLEIDLVFANNFLDLRNEFIDYPIEAYLISKLSLRGLREKVYTFFHKAEEEYSRLYLERRLFRDYFSNADIADAIDGLLEQIEVRDGVTLDLLFSFIRATYTCTVTDTANQVEILKYIVEESSPEKALFYFKDIKALEKHWAPNPQYELEITSSVYHRRIY